MGKKKFMVNEEMLRSASDYIPLHKKISLGKAIAPLCIVKSKTAEQNQKGLEFLSMPTIWIDDLETKNLYVMSVLLSEYLKIGLPDNFTDQQYDYYASAHILNQLERFKSNTELKDKVFDLLNDFRDFKKILDTEIFSEKEVRNDPIARLSAAISIASDPENIKKMQEELSKTTNELQAAQAQAKITRKGDEE